MGAFWFGFKFALGALCAGSVLVVLVAVWRDFRAGSAGLRWLDEREKAIEARRKRKGLPPPPAGSIYCLECDKPIPASGPGVCAPCAVRFRYST